MKAIRYRRHDLGAKPVTVTGSLLSFVYDIPYLPACGVFPPRHILNEVLRRGGGQGGMGPGATCEPFSLSESEYSELVAAVRETDPSALGTEARFTQARLIIDPDLDSLNTICDWTEAVCKKHRTEWLRRVGP